MPLLPAPDYRAPFYLFNGHLQTIVPSMRRQVDGVDYTRERIDTPDGDFLDLDWIRQGHRRLVVLTHGLEGNTQRQYMKGAAKALAAAGWDVLGWNCRSCGEEMNRTPRLYGHGEIGDIELVIRHGYAQGDYREVALAGFSMGGSILLKFLGVRAAQLDIPLIGGVAVSTPCHLKTCSEQLDRGLNRIYRKRFLDKLIPKILLKEAQFPGLFDVSNIESVKRMRDFDERFSGASNGYANAEEFYANSSSIHFIEGIRLPTLILSAANDPILSPQSYPLEQARHSDYLHLEIPRQGGHVGFSGPGPSAWHELRLVSFLGSISGE